MLGSILDLSLEKFSSNVIEKCLEVTTDDIKYKMVAEIQSAHSFVPYLTDQYGNYVIQKALMVADEAQFTSFIAKLKPQLPYLAQTSDFGYKIYQKVVKQYSKQLDLDVAQPQPQKKKRA